MDRLHLILLIVGIPFILASTAHAREKVNLLTWWGYINKQHIQEIGTACNVDFSVDEYYSNSEFLRRWDNKKNTHDLIIYSNTIFEIINESLTVPIQSDDISSKYPASIRTKVKSLGLPKNTRLFLISLTGFLWNTKNITLDANQSLTKMLENASGKIIIILDDPVEGMDLVKRFQIEKPDLSKQKSKILIANDKSNIINKPDFGFAYLWSGSAFEQLAEAPKDFDFMVHPKLTHLTTDQISIVKQSPGARCVFEYLSSEPFLTKLQDLTYYFSPYGKTASKNKEFLSFYKKYFGSIPEYKWLDVPSREEFIKASNDWKRLKLRFKYNEN